MHYYERNIGDYHRKAGRLNILQHGVYNLLIDACYDRERFPTLEEAIDWVWAETEEEIEAVKFVLKKFFKLNGDDQYVQTHIEEDLNQYKGFLSKQSENGKKGGRPKCSGRQKTSSNVNDSDNTGLNNESQENPNETQNNPEKPNESHSKPKPINHRTNEPSNQFKNTCPPSGEPEPVKNQNFKNEIQEIFEFWKTTLCKSDQTVLSDKRRAKINARLKEGYTIDQIKQGIIGCSKSNYHIENKHTDIELICREAGKLDRFIEMTNPTGQQSSQPQIENPQPSQPDQQVQFTMVETDYLALGREMISGK